MRPARHRKQCQLPTLYRTHPARVPARTRHQFADLHAQGIDAVVARLNMAFKTPLKSGDRFVSKLRVEKEGIKYVFYQDIFRLPDMKCCLKSQVDTVCLIEGRLGTCRELDDIVPKPED